MKLVNIFATALAASTIAGSAFAADLPARKMAPAYIAPAPIFTWTGFYVGVNLGYAFRGDNKAQGYGMVLPPATAQHMGWWGGSSSDTTGILGGLQVGYNFNFRGFLVGLETDFQGSDIKGSKNYAGAMGLGNNGAPQFISVDARTKLEWFGTLRGRLGFALPSAPNFLVYATGGLAYGNVKASATPTFVNATGGSILGVRSSFSDTRIGWTVGAGAEYAPMSLPNWSVKFEYLYTDLGSVRVPLDGAGATAGAYFANTPAYAGSHSSQTKFHTLRVGLNYRFGGMSAAPVVAKY
ncbi:MAG: outer membrane protein [Rhodoblastus sp.]